MTPIDWTILFLYAVFTMVMAWWVSRKQEDTREYFIGSGRMNPLLIGVSLFVTLLSTITYLAIPGEVLGKGPVYLANYLVYPLVFLVVTRWLLPLYMRNRVTSAYELLEERLGLSVRLLGTGLFLLLRLIWMGLLIFLTAKALVVVMGVPEDRQAIWVPWVAVVTGLFTVIYTSVGGLRAVVITDLIQTLLLYGGALIVIGTITYKMGGFGWFPTEWQQSVWDTQPIISFDLSERVTLIGSMISVLIWMVATSAGDQITVQRFMATEDAPAARRAVATQLIMGGIVGLTLGLVGLALLGYLQAHPERIPEGKSLRDMADSVFPWFIAQELPPVITGLVVAGLFAAAMSSIDSGVNSITAVVTVDILDRFGHAPKTDLERVRFSRRLSFGIGVAVVLASTQMHRIPGNFMEITNKTVNLPTVPLAMLFVYALFFRRISTLGAWIGCLASLAAAVVVAFSGPLFGLNPTTGRDPISFQWVTAAALLAGLVGGWIGSLLFPRKPETL